MSDSGAEVVSCGAPERAMTEGGPPPGARLAGAVGARNSLVPDVKVRCRAQPPDAPPLFARPRFVWNRNEVAGAFGDLGTFLPHILAAMTVVGLAPTGVLTTFGLFYLASGVFYGIPMAVQPMKAASAAVLVQRLEPGEIAGAGLVIGAFFLVIGATGLVTRLARIIPATVTSGIQLGLGLSLATLGIRLIEEQPWLGIPLAALILVLLNNRRFPAALAALVVGVALGQVAGPTRPIPPLTIGLHLPSPMWPTWDQVVRGTQLAVLPQIPLTLTNAIIVTAAVSRQLFPKEIHHANERTLSLSTGLGNLLAAPLGGYLMCHGAGGLAGHYRFGARSATAPALIGLALLALGLFLGEGALPLLALIPAAVLGSLLFFSGVELALTAQPQSYTGADLFVVLVVAAIGVASNPAVAFVVALPLAYGIRRGLVRL